MIIQIDEKGKRDAGFRYDWKPSGQPETVKPETQIKPAVTVIEAAPEKKSGIRAAAYCRVSTLSIEQDGSIKNQRKHYEEFIKGRPDWEMAGIYLETGLSGTKAETRPELQRLLADCRKGRIDLVLTKSISRFARDTVDCLEMVRELSDLGVRIVFEKENIDTGRTGSEFFLSLMAGIAQNESKSISQNVKWGIRRRFEKGDYKPARMPFGYGRNWEIIPGKAEIVREAYRRLLNGETAPAIAGSLNGAQFSDIGLRNLFRNRAYCGDLVCQKTYRDETYRQRWNKGERDQFIHEDHHEAIVSRDVYDKAVRILQCSEVKEKKHTRNALTGKVVCGCCGQPMYRDQGKLVCIGKKRLKNGCVNPYEPEQSIKNAFITCLNKLVFSRGIIVDRYAEQTQDGTETLKKFVKGWEITGNEADFPDAGFEELVDRVSVVSRKKIKYQFVCGLVLEEKLPR